MWDQEFESVFLQRRVSCEPDSSDYLRLEIGSFSDEGVSGALGAERELIRSIPGRGYQFTGEARILRARPEDRAAIGVPAAQRGSVLPPTNLPQPVSELIGRDGELHEVLSLAAAHRLVTLTGAGGIGKTRLALAAARQLLPHFADGVWLAEFSPLAGPGLVPATVAAAVGLELGAGEASAQRVALALARPAAVAGAGHLRARDRRAALAWGGLLWNRQQLST